jgi:hypothetical protein
MRIPITRLKLSSCWLVFVILPFRFSLIGLSPILGDGCRIDVAFAGGSG